MGVSTRYAVRSIGRNIRRTALSIVGIGIGCALAATTESLNRGRDEMFARTAAFSGAGHLRVVPAGWRARRDPRLRLAGWEADLAAARRLPGVETAAPRARVEALLAMGTHVVPVEIVGVDAASEPRTNRLVQRIQDGRYLRPGERGAAVVGRAIADRLRAGVDDDILATAVGARGAIETTMFRIAGIVATGSDEIDAGLCQVALEDVEQLSGAAGAGEIAVMLVDADDTERARAALVPRLAGTDEALDWGEVAPELKGHLKQDEASSRFITAVILIIVALGVASAQLAAVLERRREFAVLAAVGMPASTMVRLVLQEGIALGISGAVAGLAIGTPVVWWLARTGIDLRRLMGASYSFSGIIIEPVIYGDFGVWIVGYAAIVSVVATVLASIYPAWFAARTDPAVALRVAQ